MTSTKRRRHLSSSAFRPACRYCWMSPQECLLLRFSSSWLLELHLTVLCVQCGLVVSAVPNHGEQPPLQLSELVMQPLPLQVHLPQPPLLLCSLLPEALNLFLPLLSSPFFLPLQCHNQLCYLAFNLFFCFLFMDHLRLLSVFIPSQLQHLHQ
ncbi:hypothetical protein F7725_024860 [Dissostichus mawsoni]|uniref:Uncharacterized protein n=1 Tax=Dissostichus mawsoni TaxID=36200 RepID=A0A7J5X9G9_DISMA|nr:hypothetical protein F7725_024860 [Dissostichus mawsoni]